MGGPPGRGAAPGRQSGCARHGGARAAVPARPTRAPSPTRGGGGPPNALASPSAAAAAAERRATGPSPARPPRLPDSPSPSPGPHQLRPCRRVELLAARALADNHCRSRSACMKAMPSSAEPEPSRAPVRRQSGGAPAPPPAVPSLSIVSGGLHSCFHTPPTPTNRWHRVAATTGARRVPMAAKHPPPRFPLPIGHGRREGTRGQPPRNSGGKPT